MIRVDHELHAEVVDDLVIGFDIRVIPGHVPKTLQEEPVGHLHDVRFVYRGHFFAAVRACVLEREARDARRGTLRDDLQRLDDARHHLMLQAAVQIFRVFADDDQIDVFESGDDVRHRVHRPEVRVEVERFSQAYVDGCESGADRRRHRTFESDAVAQDGIEHFLRQWIP